MCAVGTKTEFAKRRKKKHIITVNPYREMCLGHKNEEYSNQGCFFTQCLNDSKHNYVCLYYENVVMLLNYIRAFTVTLSFKLTQWIKKTVKLLHNYMNIIGFRKNCKSVVL